MLTESKLNSGDLPLHFASGPPSGPPLVLLHGVTRRWQEFVTLLPALTLRWRVYALDFRGHGRSGRTPGKYHVVDYIRDAVAFLRQQLKEPAVVYGHSLGAMVAAAAAAEAPALVRGVVLEDPPFDTLGSRIGETPFLTFFSGVKGALMAGERSVDALAARVAEVRVPKLSPEGTLGPETVRLGDVRDPTSLRFGARCLLDMDPEVLDPLIAGRWLEGYDRDTILRKIECPALLLQADFAAGGMLPDAVAESAASLLRRGSHVKLPQVGHLIHWLAPDATLRLVSGFLESL